MCFLLFIHSRMYCMPAMTWGVQKTEITKDTVSDLKGLHSLAKKLSM